MRYYNDWGDEGTLEEVQDATLEHMDNDDLLEELGFYVSYDEIVAWAMEKCGDAFFSEFEHEITSAQNEWVRARMYELEED